MKTRRFSLKAGDSWMIGPYKGKRRVIMHREFGRIRQPTTGYDVLPNSRVRELVAWLNRFLAEESPTDSTMALAEIRVSANRIQSRLSSLEAKPK